MTIAYIQPRDYAGEALEAEAALHAAGSVLDAIAIRAAAHPDEPVLVDVGSGHRLTYRELDERSTELAGYLTDAGARPGRVLALPVDRDLTDVAVPLFAALKAGVRPMAVPSLGGTLSGEPLRVRIPDGRLATGLVLPAPAGSDGADPDPGDALYDERTGGVLPRSGLQLRQLLAPRWPKLIPMLRGMAYSLDPASFASVLMWQCWRGRTGYVVASGSVRDLARAAERYQLPALALTKTQFTEALSGPDLGHDVTSVKEIDLTFVTQLSTKDGERIVTRFPQAAGVAAPALDGRLRLLAARTGAGATTAPTGGASATPARSAPVPPLTDLLGEVPGSYVELLIGVLTRWVFEHEYLPTADPALYRRATIDRAARAIGRDWPTDAETMVGVHRLRHLASCVASLVQDGVPGDLVEAGAWRGGSCILMRAVLKALEQTDRRVWVADSFEGFPAEDFTLSGAQPASGTTSYQFPLISVDLATVQNNFSRYGLLDEQVRFVQGWFHETLPGLPVTTVALLRLDGDLYDSTMAPLAALYPRLAVGGFCVVDDYGDVTACREAVDTYRRDNGITEPIQWIDTDAICWRRTR